MLQGVCADPPSLYLWAFGVLIGCRPTRSRAHRCQGLCMKTEQARMQLYYFLRPTPTALPFANGSMPAP
jgi:hypothetical protein